jgi:mRNA interferase MazF
MSDTPLAPGDVILARFAVRNPTGHEQEGLRPAVVVGIPADLGQPRYWLVLVVPLTSQQGQPWASAAPLLYPALPVGAGGLATASIALLDQLCSLDGQRVTDWYGSLGAGEYAPILAGLTQMLEAGRS